MRFTIHRTCPPYWPAGSIGPRQPPCPGVTQETNSYEGFSGRPDTKWIIEIASLEDLLAKLDEWQEQVVISCVEGQIPDIEIYDSMRE